MAHEPRPCELLAVDCEAPYRTPVPIDLPRPSRAIRARRAGRSAAAASRRFGALMARRALRRPLPERPAARALRLTFEDLGATYVKFGQAVASSPAVIPVSI